VSYRVTVASNTMAMLDFSILINPDCTSGGVAKLWVTQAPAHGVAAVAHVDDFPKSPPASPLATCNTVRLPGVALTYTPAPGFTGADTLTFEAIDADNRDKAFQMAITVK
jgi:hypothetical protein